MSETPAPRPPQPQRVATADRRTGPQWPEPDGLLCRARREHDELSALEAAVGDDGGAVVIVARSQFAPRTAVVGGWTSRSSSVTDLPAAAPVLIPEGQVRIWLYVPPTDLRKSFDGLSALVRTKLAEDPLSGQLFVFLNRRATQLKILYFDRSGYCVWAKRSSRTLPQHADGRCQATSLVE